MVAHRILTTILLALISIRLSADTGRGIGLSAGDPPSTLKVGRQYLVVIAISQYPQWLPLASPVKDAREIRDILLERYSVDRVFELYDERATKANIIRLLVRLQEDLRTDDSLLILYAGHGHLDKNSSTGFWIPVNAGTDVFEQQNWLPHTQLRGLLANIQAAHLFVISDSCFAGDLIQATRALPDAANGDHLLKAYSLVCRQVLTSGATEKVPDVSDFAQQLKSILRRNQNPCLDTFSLYNDIRLGISSSVPLLGSLAGTGHQEGASFLLFLKNDLIAPIEAAGELQAAGLGEAATASSPASYFSGAIGGGILFAIAAMADVLHPAPLFWSKVHYNFGRSWGILGVGLVAGVMDFSGKEELEFHYEILSLPFVLEIQYLTPATHLPCLSAGLGIGLAPSRIGLDAPVTEDLEVTKLLLTASVGIGSPRFHHFRVMLEAYGLVIFYDNNPFTGISPQLRLEYAF